MQISIDDSDEDRAPAPLAACSMQGSSLDFLSSIQAASASSGAREPASGHDAVALPDAAETASIPHAAKDIAYDPRPEFVRDVAAVLKDEPLQG